MSPQLALFEHPTLNRSKIGAPQCFYTQVALATSPAFCAEVMAVFERHSGEWSTSFHHELWAPFIQKSVGSRFAETMGKLHNKLESRHEYYGSKASGPDYKGFTTAYRLIGTGDGNLADIEYTHIKPTTRPKQKRIAA